MIIKVENAQLVGSNHSDLGINFYLFMTQSEWAQSDIFYAEVSE